MDTERREILDSSLTISSQEIVNLIQSVSEEQIDTFLDTMLTLDSSRNILVSGVGTSGVAAQKIVHALRCQQYRAHYLSPGDALHGASGAVQKGDILIVISNGGTSDTVNTTARIAKDRGARVFAVTSREDSPLAVIADHLITVKVTQESDYAGLLATASILCVIALFDSMISVLQKERNFTREGFSQIHPSGKVGHDIMKNS